MNKMLREMKKENNYTLTENGAVTYKSTMNGLLDLFGMGAAYRTRSEEDCILLFMKAFKEDPKYALKCLFYLRDCRGGQGERRFFRVVCKYLADHETAAMRRNLAFVPEFGRWDDLYAFVDTKLEREAFEIIKNQMVLDLQCKTPSLLAKWLKSENTSSMESRELGAKTRKALGLTPKLYRQGLSLLRKRINIVERLMSEGRWDEIEFDKIPSRAGLIYRNAFARHDIERLAADKNAVAYRDFIRDEKTTVNAKALYPYEVVAKATQYTGGHVPPRMTPSSAPQLTSIGIILRITSTVVLLMPSALLIPAVPCGVTKPARLSMLQFLSVCTQRSVHVVHSRVTTLASLLVHS